MSDTRSSTALRWDGIHLLQAWQAAAHWLQQHAPVINQLNVFPVPDGDTGTNMHLTMHAALQGVAPEPSCGVVAHAIYRGALMGARGNSGVILSQILHGFARGLADTVQCGPAELVHALEEAAATAYRSTSDPREGTILTVIRDTSLAARAALDQRAHTMLSLLAVITEAAHTSVQRTPELLEVLREAGVVDAGGQGLYVLLEGMQRWATGAPLTLLDAPADTAARPLQPHTRLHGEDEYGYCTNVLVAGDALPLEQIRSQIEAMGSSTVVVGDEQLIRIHTHTTRPGEVLNSVMQYGEALSIEIMNMDQQRREIQQAAAAHPPVAPSPVPTARPLSRVGVVAVAAGAGFTDLFTSLGVHAVVTGGQTNNPSTAELLEAANQLPQQQVLILPNNGNVLLAAQQATSLSDKQIAVLPTRTIPQGLAAMVRFTPDANLETCIERMQPEIGHVTTAEVATAVRAATIGGIQVQQGQTIALLNGTLVAAGDNYGDVITTVLHRIDMENHELLTIYYGQQVSVAQAAALTEQIAAAYPDHEIEMRSGGQPIYDFILAAE